MERLRAILATLRSHVDGMTGASKGLLASLLVILGMVLGYVLLLSGQPDMVPLGLAANTKPEVRARVVNYLQARGIPHQEFGTEISVPSDRNFEVLGQLMNQDIIGETTVDWTSVFEEGSVFEPRSLSDRRYLVAKMRNLGLMISMLDHVDRATVMIDPAPLRHGIGSAFVPASASVMVDTAGRSMSRSQAQSIARMVAGAHSGLKPENVSVTERGTLRNYTGRQTAADVAQTERREYQEAVEADYLAKVETLLEHIPGARATVNVEVNLDVVNEWQQTVESPKVAASREDARDFATNRGPVGGEPGVRPNTGLSLPTASRSDTTETESSTRNEVRFPGGVTQRWPTPGRVVAARAVMFIPRSWILASWQTEQGDPQAVPAPGQLATFAGPILAGFEDQFRTLVSGAGSSGTTADVTASMYDDVLAGEFGLIPAPEATGGLLADFVGTGIVSTASVVLLAMVSLGLMFMLVRNAGRSDQMPSAEELVGIPPKLETDDDVIGEVGDEPFALEGKEVDDDFVRREQILEYLNNFAAEDSEEAAALLRKWLRDDVA
jgi:flagellar biosynthesis/type III secretory pathway M-ring protein FliF/YscJ